MRECIGQRSHPEVARVLGANTARVASSAELRDRFDQTRGGVGPTPACHSGLNCFAVPIESGANNL